MEEGHRSRKGYLALGAALVFCPCHLPVTLALLAGTAAGGVVGAYAGAVYAAATALFVVALVAAWRWLGAEERTAKGADQRAAIDEVDTRAISRQGHAAAVRQR